MELKALREKIDALDSQLIAVLNERAALVHEVGEIKKSQGLEIYAPEREETLLRTLIKKNEMQNGLLPSVAIRAIYREIMSASLALENDLTIAFVGPLGTWCYQVARNKFGASVRYLSQPSIADVFESVTKKQADYGIVPIENSAEGSANADLDMFIKSDLQICAQLETTDAARFFVIGNQSCPRTGHDKTAILFSIDDHPGALLGALEVFRDINVNITKIQNKSNQPKVGQVVFFVEAEGHIQDEALAKAMGGLQKHCSFVKILGSYIS